MTVQPKAASSLTARIEVFRPGTFTPMAGTPITYSAADLKAVADAYDPATAPAPIVVGHPAADAPALGWVESFEYDQNSSRLFANLNEIEPAFVGQRLVLSNVGQFAFSVASISNVTVTATRTVEVGTLFIMRWSGTAMDSLML